MLQAVRVGDTDHSCGDEARQGGAGEEEAGPVPGQPSCIGEGAVEPAVAEPL